MCAIKTTNFTIYKLTELVNETSIKAIVNPVSAGFPSPALDFIEDVIDLNILLVKHPASTFLMNVTGTSMEGEIYDGSRILVDTSLQPKSDDIGVCVINGEFTLKRILVEKKRVFLLPDNKAYKPIEITEGTDFSIWGIVTYIFKKPNSKRT